MGSWWSEAALTKQSNSPKCTLAPLFLHSSIHDPSLCTHLSQGVHAGVGVCPQKRGVRRESGTSTLPLWCGAAPQRMQPPLPCTPGLYISQWDELEKPSAVSQESPKQAPDFQIIISALSNSTTLDLMHNHSSAFWCGVVKSPRSPIGELRSTVQDCLLLYLVPHFFQMEDCLHTKYRIFRDQTLLSDLKPTTQPLRTIGPLFLQWRRSLCRRARQPHHSKT